LCAQRLLHVLLVVLLLLLLVVVVVVVVHAQHKLSAMPPALSTLSTSASVSSAKAPHPTQSTPKAKC
jgi:hypothetical protein